MTRWRVLTIALVALALFGAGFAAGATADRAALLPGAIVREPPGLAPTFSIFWQAWDLAERHYVDRKALNPNEMTYGAISGMLNALGDTGHTRFLSPQEWHAEEEAVAGRLERIGAEMVMRDGRPTILAPIPGSPAQHAGLRPGDMIVRVNGAWT